MLGAIFGDIVGSVYEIKNTKREDFPLLSKWSDIGSCEGTDEFLGTE